MNGTMGDIRQALGYEADDITHDDEIVAMSLERKFDLYCQWNGLLGGWGSQILGVIEELKSQEEQS